jgi:hypothetical protein
MSYRNSSNFRLRWHWLWFIPLCILILAWVESYTVKKAIAVISLIRQRWDWGVVISPSGDFCFTVLMVSVLWPLIGLFLIAVVVSSRVELTIRQRVIYSLLLTIGIIALPFVADALIWGSFPFEIDDQGFSRLRMFPFVPWPGYRFSWYFNEI